LPLLLAISALTVEAKEREERVCRKGRFWVRDILKRRRELDEFHRLMQELYSLDVPCTRHKCHRYFRMLIEQFDYLQRLTGQRNARENKTISHFMQICRHA